MTTLSMIRNSMVMASKRNSMLFPEASNEASKRDSKRASMLLSEASVTISQKPKAKAPTINQSNINNTNNRHSRTFSEDTAKDLKATNIKPTEKRSNTDYNNKVRHG